MQHASNLRAAAVHDDRIDARLLQVNDVLRKSVGKFGVAHRVAAEFHDDGLLVITNQMRDGFGQDARLLMRRRPFFGGAASLPETLFPDVTGVPQSASTRPDAVRRIDPAPFAGLLCRGLIARQPNAQWISLILAFDEPS